MFYSDVHLKGASVMMLAQLLAEGAKKPGLLSSLTPLQLLLGGLTLVLVACGLHWLEKKAEKAGNNGFLFLGMTALFLGAVGLLAIFRSFTGG